MGEDFVVGEVRGAGGDDLGEVVRSRSKNPEGVGGGISSDP